MHFVPVIASVYLGDLTAERCDRPDLLRFYALWMCDIASDDEFAVCRRASAAMVAEGRIKRTGSDMPRDHYFK